ncbi:MAG: hypothetical protein HC853_04675 [Anaerolineae bacterium]|nr:hypothetical protein [Anaerolineae bacterium]
MTTPYEAMVQCLRTLITIPLVMLSVALYGGFLARVLPRLTWLSGQRFRHSSAFISVLFIVGINIWLEWMM